MAELCITVYNVPLFVVTTIGFNMGYGIAATETSPVNLAVGYMFPTGIGVGLMLKRWKSFGVILVPLLLLDAPRMFLSLVYRMPPP